MRDLNEIYDKNKLRELIENAQEEEDVQLVMSLIKNCFSKEELKKEAYQLFNKRVSQKDWKKFKNELEFYVINYLNPELEFEFNSMFNDTLNDNETLTIRIVKDIGTATFDLYNLCLILESR